jgi:hypothetical protein
MQMVDSPSTGHLGGVWWPQSRDIQVEAADLVDHFSDQVGRIDRLLFSRPDWGQRRFRRPRGASDPRPARAGQGRLVPQ